MPSLYYMCLEKVLTHFNEETDLSGVDEVSCEIILRALAGRLRLTARIVESFRSLGHPKINELLKGLDTRLAVAGLSSSVDY